MVIPSLSKYFSFHQGKRRNVIRKEGYFWGNDREMRDFLGNENNFVEDDQGLTNHVDRNQQEGVFLKRFIVIALVAVLAFLGVPTTLLAAEVGPQACTFFDVWLTDPEMHFNSVNGLYR